MDNIKAMRLFLHAAQVGSMSGAGRLFGLSPASVSRQISALEDDLGVRLLNRTSRKLSMTEAGQVYLKRAERLLQDWDEMRDEVTQLAFRPQGTLRVQSRISLGTQHIAPLIPDLLTRYPELKVDLWLVDTDPDLIEHGIDVAIRTGDLSDSSLIVRRLAAGSRIICASPAYWANNLRPESPKHLAAHNCLTYRFDATPAIWRFLGPDGVPEALHATGNFQTNNAEALRLATLSGLGVALLPTWSIEGDLANGDLQRVLSEYDATPTDLDTGIYAVYHSKRHLSVKTRLFIDHLVTAFHELDWSSVGPAHKEH
ncbi:MAG: LysR family transcriptional regulator [Alphaproteobacteria bacterium]|nr:LysR family transcriptional regulator [Alphaproteobacteria bacterium]